jgi:hypothetical protein
LICAKSGSSAAPSFDICSGRDRTNSSPPK